MQQQQVTKLWKTVNSSTASYKTSIRDDSLIDVIEYLIDNICIKVGSKVFRQQVGIPMGTDCAPLLANLFLFYYEI